MRNKEASNYVYLAASLEMKDRDRYIWVYNRSVRRSWNVTPVKINPKNPGYPYRLKSLIIEGAEENLNPTDPSMG